MKTWNEIKADIDQKFWEFKLNAEFKLKSLVQWCTENEELAIAMIPVGIAAVKGVTSCVKSIDRKIDLKREQDLQDLYVYDHSLGMYHKLRRPLKHSEKIEIDHRRQEGETKIHILASMGLLD